MHPPPNGSATACGIMEQTPWHMPLDGEWQVAAHGFQARRPTLRQTVTAHGVPRDREDTVLLATRPGFAPIRLEDTGQGGKGSWHWHLEREGA